MTDSAAETEDGASEPVLAESKWTKRAWTKISSWFIRWRRAWIATVWIVSLVATFAAIWAVFHFVITGEKLMLDYIRVLSWPVVVSTVFYWLRGPVRDKVSSLLRVQFPGGLAEFEARASQSLESALRKPMSVLVGDSADIEDLSEDSAEDDEIASPGLDPIQNRTDESAKEAVSDDAEPADTGSDHSDVSRAAVMDLLELAEAAGMSAPARARALKRAEASPAAVRDDLLRSLNRRVANLLSRSKNFSAETRDSVESVIQKSAAWGYKMGSSGAPQTVPDVEWQPDGTWKIVTEVPDRGSPRPGKLPAADRSRQIRSFEDEIKLLERKRTRLGGGSLLMLSPEEAWLKKLKRRLAEIDPGNPWTTSD